MNCIRHGGDRPASFVFSPEILISSDSSRLALSPPSITVSIETSIEGNDSIESCDELEEGESNYHNQAGRRLRCKDTPASSGCAVSTTAQNANGWHGSYRLVDGSAESWLGT